MTPTLANLWPRTPRNDSGGAVSPVRGRARAGPFEIVAEASDLILGGLDKLVAERAAHLSAERNVGNPPEVAALAAESSAWARAVVRAVRGAPGGSPYSDDDSAAEGLLKAVNAIAPEFRGEGTA